MTYYNQILPPIIFKAIITNPDIGEIDLLYKYDPESRNPLHLASAQNINPVINKSQTSQFPSTQQTPTRQPAKQNDEDDDLMLSQVELISTRSNKKD